LGRRLPAGRKDVTEEQDLLIGQPIGDLHVGMVRAGDAHILGLAARVAAGEVGIAEQARGGVAERLVGDLLVPVGALADREVAPLALVAFAADDREGHDHLVATFRAPLACCPSSTTSSMNSCPMTSPFSMPGMRWSYRCRSEPQIAQLVTLTMASRGCSIFGSGTVSQRMSAVPCQTSARIFLLLRICHGSANGNGAEKALETAA